MPSSLASRCRVDLLAPPDEESLLTKPIATKSSVLKSPYPWFGGKSRVSSLVWSRFGEVRNYVEPFFGSGAVLLQRPTPFSGVETINDLDGFVANFWRALKADPEAVAEWCDWPVNENDLHARHAWLVERKDSMQSRLEGDPDWFDAKAAGWWAWGLGCWIGSGWCDGSLSKKRPYLGGGGRGVNRTTISDLRGYFGELSDRLRRVRVCCGDWERTCSDPTKAKLGSTAVFLDPPYSAEANRYESLYAQEDIAVAHRVRAWCVERGDDPKIRIALCGYKGEHEALEETGWSVAAWSTGGQIYAGSGNTNADRERIWFSPHCLNANEASATLF